MNYLYIAGLEHSGTTLLSELLAVRSSVLSLGEVGVFFSPSHMKCYLDTWGGYDDARLCSCGASWEACSFWGPIVQLSGEHSSMPLEDKYIQLLAHIKAHHSEFDTIVDSTKSLPNLRQLMHSGKLFARSKVEFQVVFAAKDVRSFAASIVKKEKLRSILSIYRSMNWWRAVNQQILEALKEDLVEWHLVLYENLCRDVDATVNKLIGQPEDMREPVGLGKVSLGSHIVMGNKDFMMRNRRRLRYDDAWFRNDRIQLAYLLNRGARRLNHQLHGNALQF